MSEKEALKLAILARKIADYIDEHENDGGSITELELNAQTMHTLSALEEIVKRWAYKIWDVK